MSFETVFGAFDARHTPPQVGCQAVPALWWPDEGVSRPDQFVGVRWACLRCGLEGKPVWGPANSLADLVREAEVGFRGTEEVHWR